MAPIRPPVLFLTGTGERGGEGFAYPKFSYTFAKKPVDLTTVTGFFSANLTLHLTIHRKKSPN